MISLGGFFLVICFLVALYGAVGGLLAISGRARSETPRLLCSVRNATYLNGVLSVLSLGALVVAFLVRDYRYLYVWKNANNSMVWSYRISAVWGGMDGSLLLWAALGGIFAAWALRSELHSRQSLGSVGQSAFIAVLNISSAFFYAVVLFWANPFRWVGVDFIPGDGNGLNPLLQNPSMLIHPPLLYLGFVGFVVPFAYIVASLVEGVPMRCCGGIRWWTMLPWLFLTVGILLGGNWAYIELGWGGFWAWDPVENASFLPWLAGTAFLHSAMVESRRGAWSLATLLLAGTTYLLSVFGTFLTRSGVVQSVHAFADSDVGTVFLVYLLVLTVSFVVLVIMRRKLLADNVEPSRSLSFSESSVFLGVMLIVSITLTTIWGVLLPVFSSLFGWAKQVVGPEYYNSVNGPLFVVMIVLMVVSNFLVWKKDRARLLSWDRRRFGALAAHVGVIIIAIAAYCSTVYKLEQDWVMKVGDRKAIGNFELELADLNELKGSTFSALSAVLNIYKGGSAQQIGTLKPQRRFYPASDSFTSEVDIRMRLTEDLYVAFVGVGELPAGTAPQQVDRRKVPIVLKVFVNPLQVWLWVGSAIMTIGILCCIGTSGAVKRG